MLREDYVKLRKNLSLFKEDRVFDSLPEKELLHAVEELIHMMGNANEWAMTEHIIVFYDTNESKYTTPFTCAMHILFYDSENAEGEKISISPQFLYFQYTVWANPTMSLSMREVKINNEFKVEYLECLRYGEWFWESATFMEPFLGWEDCLCLTEYV